MTRIQIDENRIRLVPCYHLTRVSRVAIFFASFWPWTFARRVSSLPALCLGLGRKFAAGPKRLG